MLLYALVFPLVVACTLCWETDSIGFLKNVSGRWCVNVLRPSSGVGVLVVPRHPAAKRDVKQFCWLVIRNTTGSMIIVFLKPGIT